jgi:heme/copper-type cytochrome/quinol oxidase subunit 3
MKRSLQKTGDVASLPDYSFGPTTPGWWGVVGFILIEGIGFVLAIGAYYYLVENETRWPPHASAPPLLWSTVFLLIGIASEWPNVWVKKRAEALDLRGVQLGLAIMAVIGLMMLAVRGAELATMNVRWDSTAYGSIVWALLVLHTFHTLTDWWDTTVLLGLTLAHEIEGRHFSDVADNSFYWHFIVGSWVVLYLVVYWTPRWL